MQSIYKMKESFHKVSENEWEMINVDNIKYLIWNKHPSFHESFPVVTFVNL